MKAILDAGALIAAWDEADEHHRWAEKVFREHPGPYLTSEAVLTEVAHMTGHAEDVVRGIKSGGLIIAATLHGDAILIERMLSAYPGCGIADASIVVISEKHPHFPVLTTDKRHFRIYRRADKSALPLIVP